MLIGFDTDCAETLALADFFISSSPGRTEYSSHCADAHEQQLPLHIGMDGALELIAPGAVDGKSDHGVSGWIQEHAFDASSIGNDPVALYLHQATPEHMRA